MDENASTLMPDTSQQPLRSQPPKEHSGMLSFLKKFGGKKGNNANFQQASEPVQQPLSAGAPLDFVSRLNTIDSQPPTNPVDTSPSMDSADVVAGPNLPASPEGLAAQQPIPPQEPPMQVNDGLGASATDESTAHIGEPTIGIPTPASAEMSSPAETTPNLTGSVNPPAQDVLSQPVGGDVNISEEPASALSKDASEQLKSTKETLQKAVDDAFAEIDQIFKANSTGAPAATPVGASKEPVGVGTS